MTRELFVNRMTPARIEAIFDGHRGCPECNDIWDRPNPKFTWIRKLSVDEQIRIKVPQQFYIGSTPFKHYPITQRIRDKWINETRGDLIVPGSGLIDPRDFQDDRDPIDRAERRRQELANPGIPLL